MASTSSTRAGAGHRAYRRQRDALANRYRRHGWPCPVCGKPFDWDHPQSTRGFTADHPVALNAGGKLIQKLDPMCRGCNARKSDVVTPPLPAATLPSEPT